MEIMIIVIVVMAVALGVMKYRDTEGRKLVKSVATAIGSMSVTAMIPLGVVMVSTGSAFALLGAAVMVFVGVGLLTASMDS